MQLEIKYCDDVEGIKKFKSSAVSLIGHARKKLILPPTTTISRVVSSILYICFTTRQRSQPRPNCPHRSVLPDFILDDDALLLPNFTSRRHDCSITRSMMSVCLHDVGNDDVPKVLLEMKYCGGDHQVPSP